VNLLLALLAFAGIMAFLSTLVSVFIEGVHKALSLRRAGLEEMLRSLHRNVLVQLDPAASQGAHLDTRAISHGSDRESARFARQMTANIAIEGRGLFSWVRRVPILSGLFQRKHERLSTLQFVEQLARSDVGGAVRTFPRAQRQRALTAAAYEFERFGDAQTAYFQSRARVLSVILSIAFAFAANIDALAIYNRLANDSATRDSVLRSIDVAAIERLEAEYEAARQADPPRAEALRAQIDTMRARVRDLGELGLPLGYAAFPFCVGYVPATSDSIGVSARGDRRCNSAQSAAIGFPRALDLDNAWARLRASEHAWLWLLSVIAAGAFIGLGAPFWFQVFRRIAHIIPTAQSVRAALQSSEPATQAATQREGVRDPNAANPSALLLAFDVASGNVAQSIVDPAVSTALDVQHAPLIVRGDGSVAAAPGDLSRQFR
jgi:hypothetical protein